MSTITVKDLIATLQKVPSKQKELPIIVRNKNTSEGIANLFMGVESASGVNFPQIGEEPTCVVLQITDSTEEKESE